MYAPADFAALLPAAGPRRIALALVLSVAAHSPLLALDYRPAWRFAPAPWDATLTVLLAASRSAPQNAGAELTASTLEGGGNSEAAGHAESLPLQAEGDAHATLPRQAQQVRVLASETLSLPTERRIALEGQRAPVKAQRLAAADSRSGSGHRGGDDCRIAGFRFCSN